jgi:hypothetical protein
MLRRASIALRFSWRARRSNLLHGALHVALRFSWRVRRFRFVALHTQMEREKLSRFLCALALK